MTKRAKKNRGWFEKGTSGNPRGRPNNSRNQSTLLEDIVNTPVPVTENGKKKIITKREAYITQLVNKAAGGDLRATKMIEDMYERSCKNKAPLPQASSEPLLSGGPATEQEASELYYAALKKVNVDE